MANLLNSMLESYVKLDNQLVWDGRQHPFFETYTLVLNHPQKNWSLWVKYLINNPDASSKNGRASVCAGFLDENGQKLSLKEDYELIKHDIVHANQFISIRDSSLSLADAMGCVQQKQNCIKWELGFEDPVISNRPYPNSWFYRLAIPRTKFVTPRLKSHVSGQIYVNNQKKELSHLKVHQNHHFGEGLTQNWAKVHCIHFKDNPEAYFEALTIVPSVKNRHLRPLHFVRLNFQGESYQTNYLMKMILNQGKVSNDRLEIDFKSKGLRFECSVKRLKHKTFGCQHKAPNKNFYYTYLCPKSEIDIKIFKPNKGKDELIKHLSSSDAVFETLSAKQQITLPLDVLISPQ